MSKYQDAFNRAVADIEQNEMRNLALTQEDTTVIQSLSDEFGPDWIDGPDDWRGRVVNLTRKAQGLPELPEAEIVQRYRRQTIGDMPIGEALTDIGGVRSTVQGYKERSAIQALEKGEALGSGQYAALQRAAERERADASGSTMGAQIGYGAAVTAPFIAEMAATGGVGTAAKTGVRTAGRKALQKMGAKGLASYLGRVSATKGAETALRNIPAKVAIRGVEAGVSGLARSAALPTRALAGALEDSMPGVTWTRDELDQVHAAVSDPEMGLTSAFVKNYLQTAIEFGTEELGESFAGLADATYRKLLPAAVKQKIGGGVVAYLAGKAGGNKKKFLDTLSRVTGVQGAVPEFFEEDAGQLAEYIMNTVGEATGVKTLQTGQEYATIYGQPDTAEALAVRAGVLAVPQLGRGVVGGAAGRITGLDRRARLEQAQARRAAGAARRAFVDDQNSQFQQWNAQAQDVDEEAYLNDTLQNAVDSGFPVGIMDAARQQGAVDLTGAVSRGQAFDLLTGQPTGPDTYKQEAQAAGSELAGMLGRQAQSLDVYEDPAAVRNELLKGGMSRDAAGAMQSRWDAAEQVRPRDIADARAAAGPLWRDYVAAGRGNEALATVMWREDNGIPAPAGAPSLARRPSVAPVAPVTPVGPANTQGTTHGTSPVAPVAPVADRETPVAQSAGTGGSTQVPEWVSRQAAAYREQQQAAQHAPRATFPRLDSVSLEDAKAIKADVDRQHARLVEDADGDVAQFGPDSPESQASKAALEAFERENAAWTGVGGAKLIEARWKARKTVAPTAQDAPGDANVPVTGKQASQRAKSQPAPAAAAEQPVTGQPAANGIREVPTDDGPRFVVQASGTPAAGERGQAVKLRGAWRPDLGGYAFKSRAAAEEWAGRGKAVLTAREYSSTQVDLPRGVALKAKRASMAISEDDLAGDGRETRAHVTVKYGIHGNDSAAVTKALAGEGPIKVRLGKTTVFPASESGGDFDVVVVDVDSPDLHRLNKKIADAVPVTDTFPEYKPHVTLAYVKPGTGKKYAGMTDLEGEEMTLKSVTFSGKDKTETQIPLTGAPRTTPKAKAKSKAKKAAASGYAPASELDLDKESPWIRQYVAAKKEAGDSLVFFRMGDFYELLFEDAERAADVLGITLTSRDASNGRKIAMAGVPARALEQYLKKAAAAGVPASVVDPVEKAEGDVKRVVMPTGKALRETAAEPAAAAQAPESVQRVNQALADAGLGSGVTVITADEIPDEIIEALAKASGVSVEEARKKRHAIKGAYMGNRVWLVADTIAKFASREGVSLEAYALGEWAHEVGIHQGLRAYFIAAARYKAKGVAEYEKMMLSVLKSLGGRDAVLAALHNSPTYASLSDVALAEEYLAHLAGKRAAGLKGKDLLAWKRFLHALKDLFTKLKGDLTDADLNHIVDSVVGWMAAKQRGQEAAGQDAETAEPARAKQTTARVGQTKEKRKTPQKRKYYRRVSETKGTTTSVSFEEIPDAKPVTIPGFEDIEFVLHKTGKLWGVTEASTGLKAGRLEKTPKEAIESATYWANRAGDKLKESISDYVKTNGPLPENELSREQKVARDESVLGKSLREPLQDAAVDAQTEPGEAEPVAEPASDAGQGGDRAGSDTEEPKDAAEPAAADTHLEDAGEKIGGARKDLWAHRGLEVSDLEGMTAGEEYEHVTKPNVWATPDYQALIDGGADPVAVRLIKTVYDRIAARPARDTAEGRRDYITMMRIIRQVTDGVRTVAEARNIDQNVYATLKAQFSDWQIHRRMYASVLKANQRKSATGIAYSDVDRAIKETQAGWPAPQPAYMKGREIRQGSKDGLFFVTKGYSILEEGFASKAEAEAWLKEQYETREAKKPEMPERPHLDDLKRTGADVRNGKDVGSQDFIEHFGFRGVEFGNWVASDERQKSVNMAFDALHDLARVMTISPKAVSLGGRLAIAFGARGSGRAGAHYEPGKLVINLTKLRGGGALAHEFAHAMDHYFGEMNRDTGSRGEASFESDIRKPQRRMDAGNLRSELQVAYDGIMRAIYERDLERADLIREAEHTIERADNEIARVTGYIERAEERKTPAKIVQDYHRYVAQMKDRKAAATAKAEQLRAGADFKTSTARTKFLTGAQKLGKYWERPHEMFARAFEAYVFDKIGVNDTVSEYLVHGVEGNRYADEQRFKANPYPAESERASINAAFDSFFQTVETKDNDSGLPVMFSAAFSRRPERIRGYGMPAERLTGIVERVAARWTNGPAHIRVVQSETDLPEHVIRSVRRRGVRGAWDPDTDDVYLVADNLRSRDEALFVLAHEVVGHRGIEGVLGTAANGFYMDLAMKRYGVREYARDKKMPFSTAAEKRAAAREWLADRVGRGEFENQPWWKKLLDMLRRALGRITGRQNWTDAELGDLVKVATGRLTGEANMTGGGAGPTQAGQDTDAEPRFSMAPDATADPPAMRSALESVTQWVKDVRAARVEKDINGKPDIRQVDLLLRSPVHYSEDVPTYKKIVDAAMRLRDDKETFKSFVFNKDADVSELRGLMKYAKANKEEAVLLNQYLLKRDRDAVGYRVKESEGKAATAAGGGYTLFNPRGQAVGTFDNEADAWEAGYQAEARDLVEGRFAWNLDESPQPKFSPAAAEAVIAFRHMTHRSYELLRREAEQLKKTLDAEGLEVPRVMVKRDGETISLDLFAALAEMGDQRGHYFPRIRTGGRFQLIMTKDGEPSRLEKYSTKERRAIDAVKYRRQGYKVTMRLGDAASQEAYVDAGILALNDLVNNTLKRIKGTQTPFKFSDFNMEGSWQKTKDGKREFMVKELGGHKRSRTYDAMMALGGQRYDAKRDGIDKGVAWHFVEPEKDIETSLIDSLVTSTYGEQQTLQAFGQAFALQMAEMLHARGSRSAKIGRSEATGADVWQGYEEDMVKAVTLHGSSLAGGSAKRLMAKSMMKAFMGTDVSWKEYLDENMDEDLEPDTPEYRQRRRELWTEYQAEVDEKRIDSSKQPNAYADAQSFMAEMLRNETETERVAGVIRGMASLKYLSGISTGLVNLTALLTTVPASMKGFGNIALSKVPGLVTRGLREYGQHFAFHRFGKGEALTGETKWLFDEITRRGWDEAPFNQEAVAALQNSVQRGWARASELAMTVFATTEKFNRASTIAGAYYGLREQGMSQEDALEKAKHISDKAHGVYGKVNLPAWARGSHAGAQILRSAYMFKTFSHNLLQVAHELGFQQRDKQATAWMILAPVILAGPGALLGKNAIEAIIKAVWDVFGEPPDDPEEAFYQWAEDTFGTPGRMVSRAGAFGLVGIDISGSLGIELGVGAVPTKVSDLLGAPWSVVEDVWQGTGQVFRGNVLKGAEQLAPRVLGSPIKAVRETAFGVTSQSNQPVYYGDDPLKANYYDALLRSLGFNPSRMSTIRQRQWNEKLTAEEYADERSTIYQRARRLLVTRRPKSEWVDLLADIERYNARVKRQKPIGVAEITDTTMKRLVTQVKTAPKRELERE